MTSREKILEAAVTVFAKKGRNGAHMEEIAAEAVINKAMIYYIFHGKDELYLEVLKKVFGDLYAEMIPMYKANMEKSLPDKEHLVLMIDSMVDSFTRHGNFTRILVDAMSNGVDEIAQAIQHCRDIYGSDAEFNEFDSILAKGRSGGFRDVDAEQVGLSIYGMVLIFYLSRPLSEVLGIRVENESEFLEQRKKSIIDLILYGVLAR